MMSIGIVLGIKLLFQLSFTIGEIGAKSRLIE